MVDNNRENASGLTSCLMSNVIKIKVDSIREKIEEHENTLNRELERLQPNDNIEEERYLSNWRRRVCAYETAKKDLKKLSGALNSIRSIVDKYKISREVAETHLRRIIHIELLLGWLFCDIGCERKKLLEIADEVRKVLGRAEFGDKTLKDYTQLLMDVEARILDMEEIESASKKINSDDLSRILGGDLDSAEKIIDEKYDLLAEYKRRAKQHIEAILNSRHYERGRSNYLDYANYQLSAVNSLVDEAGKIELIGYIIQLAAIDAGLRKKNNQEWCDWALSYLDEGNPVPDLPNLDESSYVRLKASLGGVVLPEKGESDEMAQLKKIYEAWDVWRNESYKKYADRKLFENHLAAKERFLSALIGVVSDKQRNVNRKKRTWSRDVSRYTAERYGLVIQYYKTDWIACFLKMMDLYEHGGSHSSKDLPKIFMIDEPEGPLEMCGRSKLGDLMAFAGISLIFTFGAFLPLTYTWLVAGVMLLGVVVSGGMTVAALLLAGVCLYLGKRQLMQLKAENKMMLKNPLIQELTESFEGLKKLDTELQQNVNTIRVINGIRKKEMTPVVQAAGTSDPEASAGSVASHNAAFFTKATSNDEQYVLDVTSVNALAQS